MKLSWGARQSTIGVGRFAGRRHAATVALIVVALIYSFCAGFRTIGDFDFGWQIAIGRYVAQHHQIPTADVLSFTAAGEPWLYPPVGGVVLYWLYLLGGYSALSWLLAIAAVGTIALLLSRAGTATAFAAILAVPSIVFRETPRSELFTTLLFAVYVAILWRWFREGRGPLWLVAVLMIVWVNLHPGFIAGLAMLGGYVLLEVCELPFSLRRAAARERLRRAAPWLAATVLATCVNPWGPRIYIALLRQNASVKQLGDFIGEWSRPNLSVAVLHQMLEWRNPESSFWWLLVLTAVAIGFAVWRKQIGPAILLAASATLALGYLRFQGLFACMAVVIGGAIFDDFLRTACGSERCSEIVATRYAPEMAPRIGAQRKTTIQLALAAAACAALILLTAVRCADLITNRHYIEAGEVVLFGPGEAAWYPERAAKFIEDHHLPGNMFNDYNLGGFLEWRLPEYKAYVDSRAIPFGVDLLTRQRSLLATPLDSPDWAKEADARNINFVIVSLDRYTGLGKVSLQEDCQSRNWRPVYMDETATVFLRNSASTTALVQALAIDCATVQFAEPVSAQGSSFRARGNAYNFLANAGSIFYVLGRDREAQQYLALANQIDPHDANLHLTLAQLYQTDGQLDAAEREYKTSIAQRPTDLAWYLLGVLYGKEHRYPQARDAIEHSAEISYNPADRYRIIGQVENAMDQPREALKWFNRAGRTGSRGSADDQRIFAAQLAAGRARSWELLHEIDRAIAEQRKAAELQPNEPSRWATLANLYREKGDTASAAEAQARATALAAH